MKYLLKQRVDIKRTTDRPGLQALALLDVLDDLVGLGVVLHWVAGHDLPVVEGALGEGLGEKIIKKTAKKCYFYPEHFRVIQLFKKFIFLTCPPVFDLRSAVKPKDSLTGR